MSYIAQTYDPFAIQEKAIFEETNTFTSLNRLRAIAEMAKRDLEPGNEFSNFEVRIWELMRECMEDAVDSRNYYDTERGAKKNSQLLHAL